MCDFPPDASWTLFACTMFHLHHHPRARWAYSFPALSHLAIAGCSYLSAVHHQFFFHQGVSRPMLWMKQLTTISFNKFSNFLTLKAPRTGRGIKLYSLYLNCSVAVLLYSALSLQTGCIFFNTIQTFHIKLWKKQLFGLFCLCLSELNIISLLFCFFFTWLNKGGFVASWQGRIILNKKVRQIFGHLTPSEAIYYLLLGHLTSSTYREL